MGGVEPGLKEKELSRERHPSTFRHRARRGKGIIPSTLHPAMFRAIERHEVLVAEGLECSVSGLVTIFV